jgi:hypothetical protein
MIIPSKAGWQERVISVRLYSLLNYIAFQGTYTPPYWTFQENRACPFLSISLLRGWDAAMESWWLELTNLKVAQIGLILDVTWKGGKDMTTRLIDSLAKWVFHATRIIPS